MCEILHQCAGKGQCAKLMPTIDRWVLKSLLSTLEEHWSELSALPFSWAINLSGQTLSDEEFEKFVSESLTASKVPAHRIGFEITETAAIERLAAAKSLIKATKQLGCTFYLDDFGSGLRIPTSGEETQDRPRAIRDRASRL